MHTYLRALTAGVLLLAWGCADDAGSVADGGMDDQALPDARVETDASVPGNWITLKAGSFSMGSPAAEACRDADESARKVTLTRALAISATEVTQGQFSQLMGYNPSFHTACGKQCPVDWVSWHEAAAYCNALSKLRGLPDCYQCSGSEDATRCQLSAARPADCRGFRLPTEAEWEYAARAGSSTAFPNGGISSCMTTDAGAGAIAWYKVNSTGQAHPVKGRAANAWGLYDMAGNVYEWTGDWYTKTLGAAAATDPAGPAKGSERVFKGGAWYFNAEHARPGNRERFAPDKRFTFVGFRCVRTLTGKGGTP